jgi:hypothetical protein
MDGNGISFWQLSQLSFQPAAMSSHKMNNPLLMFISLKLLWSKMMSKMTMTVPHLKSKSC